MATLSFLFFCNLCHRIASETRHTEKIKLMKDCTDCKFDPMHTVSLIPCSFFLFLLIALLCSSLANPTSHAALQASFAQRRQETQV